VATKKTVSMFYLKHHPAGLFFILPFLAQILLFFLLTLPSKRYILDIIIRSFASTHPPNQSCCFALCFPSNTFVPSHLLGITNVASGCCLALQPSNYTTWKKTIIKNSPFTNQESSRTESSVFIVLLFIYLFWSS